MVPLPKIKVAVIEDDALVLRAMERLLEANAFEALPFSSAEAFLTCGDMQSARCLIIDIHLAGISGIELRDRLVALGSPPPIIFMTGMDNSSTSKRAIDGGCVAYLTKPFRAGPLLDAIQRATASTSS
jgi:FixJ family two-component response regulator